MKVLNDNVYAIIKSHCIFYFFVFNMVSFRGQKKPRPHPDCSLLGIYFKISNEHPSHFCMGGMLVSPPPPPPPPPRSRAFFWNVNLLKQLLKPWHVIECFALPRAEGVMQGFTLQGFTFKDLMLRALFDLLYMHFFNLGTRP